VRDKYHHIIIENRRQNVLSLDHAWGMSAKMDRIHVCTNQRHTILWLVQAWVQIPFIAIFLTHSVVDLSL